VAIVSPNTPGGPTPVAVSADYTASPGELVLANAAAGSFTVTLPLAPPTGAQVAVKEVSGVNPVTVAPSLGDQILPLSLGEGTVAADGAKTFFYVVDVSSAWYGIGSYAP
jgi:hypothetical protein